MTQKITPFLWFDNNAEEAMRFYTSIFKDSTIKNVHRIGDQLLTGTFELNGQEFMVLNGGPRYKFTEAVSLFVKCETQEEADEYWDKLVEGGQEQPCGWLKDRFGLSWQIIPNALGELLGDKDPARAKRVMDAMLKMKKIEVAKLRAAYEGDDTERTASAAS
jgi:predicted 3-demethylubiquinone-9 3-methyltransferase (glyoxalase superfamily)